MVKQLGKLEIDKINDYNDKVVKALEDSGFVVVLESETLVSSHYIVAVDMNEKTK